MREAIASLFFFSMKTPLSMYESMLSALGPQHWWPGQTRFEIAMGAILTQNTAWTNVEKAIANLRKERMLSAKAMNAAPKTRLAAAIRPSGYYNQKAKKLKCFLSFFERKYGSSFKEMANQTAPNLRKELLSIHGIGPETADSILLYALEKPIFVVDAYTRRIFSRHGFCKPDEDYHDLQRFFMERLPQDVSLFNEYHALIVHTGKNFCKKSRPLCQGCPLAPHL